MTVFEWSSKTLDDFSQTDFFRQGCGISVGSFDGLHLGHRFLLNKLVEECRAQRLVWAAKQALGNAALGALFA